LKDNPADVRQSLRSELRSSLVEFHQLLDALTDEDWRKRSRNAGWTNGEILFHITLGFIVVSRLVPIIRREARLPKRYSLQFAHTLDFLTPPFNRINAFAARMGGKIYNRRRIRHKFDRVHAAVIRALHRVKNDELVLGIHLPSRWDPLFGDYMTLEDVFRYPIKHFKFHREQLSVTHHP